MSVSTPRPGGPRRDKISSRVNLTDYLVNRSIRDDVLQRVRAIREKVREQDEETVETARQWVQKWKKQKKSLQTKK